MTTPLKLYPDADETIEGVGRALRAGRTTCAAVLEHCFRQIDLWDDRVHAWVFVDRAGAMQQARERDAELKAGRDRGPLHGIPIGIKDIIDVAGLPTAAGFRPWRDQVAVADAPLVGALREAGAVIMGKTVTTQFAWIDPPATRNPWNTERTPGGSSSGSAAAVATGMCLAAIGTQTGGSIIRPAAFCGVCGYKLEWLSVQTEGVIPFAPSLDHIGLLARSVGDLVLVARVIGDRPRGDDGQCDGEETRAPTLYRLGGLYHDRCEPAMASAYTGAMQRLADAGARVVEGSLPLDEVHWSHRVIMASEAAAGHERRLTEHRADYRPRIRELVEEGLKIRAVDYTRAQDHRIEFSIDVTDTFAYPETGTEAQAIALPAAPGPAPGPETTGDALFNSPWSFSGHPVVCLPIGLSPDGLPLSLQLVGPELNRQGDLYAAARWCERVLKSAARRTEG